jgi:hypothetical protein
MHQVGVRFACFRTGGADPSCYRVYGGDDRTAHPDNGQLVITLALNSLQSQPPAQVEITVCRGQVDVGHANTQTAHLDAARVPREKQWVVISSGHACDCGGPFPNRARTGEMVPAVVMNGYLVVVGFAIYLAMQVDAAVEVDAAEQNAHLDHLDALGRASVEGRLNRPGFPPFLNEMPHRDDGDNAGGRHSRFVRQR